LLKKIKVDLLLADLALQLGNPPLRLLQFARGFVLPRRQSP